MGDACDNCSPSNKKLCPTAASCANPGQKDTGDGDGIGDICDPFPACAKNDFASCIGCSTLTKDAYCKLVGGSNCAQQRYTPTCGNGTCPTAVGQACVVDGANTRCLKGPDEDSDGFPDVCDECLGFNNSVGSQFSLFDNNLEAEAYSGQTSLGDRCDPSPIGVLFGGDPPTEEYDVLTSQFTPSAVVDAARKKLEFFTNASLGKKTDTEIAKSTTGTYQFRGCQCDTTINTKCVEASGSCPAGDPLGANAAYWKTITLKDAGGTLLSPPSQASESFSNVAPGSDRKWTWQWWDDKYTNNKFPLPLLSQDEYGTPVKYPYMKGGIAVEVIRNAPVWTTGRTREDNYNLRYTFLEVSPGAVVEKKKNSHGDLEQYNPGCKFGPGCVLWANWREVIYSQPGDILFNEGISLGMPSRGNIYQAGYDTDTKVPVSAPVADLLSNLGTYVTAQPVESTRQRRSSGDYREFAILPQRWSISSGVKMLRLSRQGMKMEQRVLTAGSATAPGGKGDVELSVDELGGPENDSITVPSGEGYEGYKALLSTTLDTILVAGGHDGDQRNTGVWSYNLSQKIWQPALRKASPVPSSEVRAMAFDAAQSYLYLLFRSDSHYFSLVRYDLKKDAGLVLATLQDSGLYSGVYLNVLTDGTLVMTTSTETNHIGYAYTVSANGMTFLGTNQGSGSIPFPPQLGATELIWPTVDSNKALTYSTAPKASFSGGQACSAL